MIFNDSTINYIQLGMDVTSIRQNVIASNIANIDTPHYREKTVKFSNFMENNQLPLYTTNPDHIKSDTHPYKIVVEASNNYTYRNDENNVNLTQQEADLAKNQILYDALVGFAKYKFGEYKYIISSSQGA